MQFAGPLRRRSPLTQRPGAFPWAPEGGIQGRGIGASAARFRLAGITSERFVDPAGSGTGATPASPRATLWQELLGMTGPTRIYVREREGVTLDLATGIAGVAIQHSLELIAVSDLFTLAPGRVRVSMSAPLTWSAAGGGAYQATMAGGYAFTPYAVVDEASLDGYGGGAWLTPVADLAAVQGAAGSWAKVGSTLYVRTSDGRAPDADVFVLKNDNNARLTDAAGSLFFDGVDLLGGTRCLWVPDGDRVTLSRCSAKYGSIGGVLLYNLSRATLLDCAATGNGHDGVAYTDVDRWLEVNVESCNNGHPFTPTNTANGSTSHGTSHGVRVDGTYLYNQGPNLADVLGASSWNVRCRASGTIATQLTQRVGVWSQGTVYLDSCDVRGNPEADLWTQDTDSVVRVHASGYDTIGGSGQVIAGRG